MAPAVVMVRLPGLGRAAARVRGGARRRARSRARAEAGRAAGGSATRGPFSQCRSSPPTVSFFSPRISRRAREVVVVGSVGEHSGRMPLAGGCERWMRAKLLASMARTPRYTAPGQRARATSPGRSCGREMKPPPVAARASTKRGRRTEDVLGIAGTFRAVGKIAAPAGGCGRSSVVAHLDQHLASSVVRQRVAAARLDVRARHDHDRLRPRPAAAGEDQRCRRG